MLYVTHLNCAKLKPLGCVLQKTNFVFGLTRYFINILIFSYLTNFFIKMC